jgi:DNA-3-methyladenine glycosylase I
MTPKRCCWANPENKLYLAYHDNEWGQPVHDDRVLFEFLVLEGAQAGLSWETILKKRENYRTAFAGFDPLKVSKFSEKKIQKLLLDPGIVRNRLKVRSAVENAKAFLKIQKEFGSFDQFIWGFVHFKPIRRRPKDQSEFLARTQISDQISQELKLRGFNFVGSTICYAYMQAVGLVDDHQKGCFRARRQNVAL